MTISSPGARSSTASALRASPAPAPAQPGRIRHAEDTVTGCRQRSLADRQRAAAIPTDNARRKFEASAAAWDDRADLLERLEGAFLARAAAAAAHRSAVRLPFHVA